MLRKLLPEQPVDDHEIKTGDLIVGLNASAVGSVDELHKLLNEEVIRSRTATDVLRNGHRITIGVMAGEMR